MALDSKQEAIKLLRESLKELDYLKGSISHGIQKLKQASQMVDDRQLIIWCDVQLGKPEYKKILHKLASPISSDEQNEKLDDLAEKIKEKGIQEYLNKVDLDYFSQKSSGGIESIGFIEEKYNNLVRRKQGNDGTYYSNDLLKRLNYIRNLANEKALGLLKRLAFTENTKTAFDYLKEEVDDKLLDLDPELAERLMVVFKSVSTDSAEEWSQALTTCRRIVEKLADELFPPIGEEVKGRKLGQGQYINRLWAFMDKAIESKSNKEIAKAHVDILGIYIQSNHKLTNKGVHTDVTKIEAVKTVFHIYLMLADLLAYLDRSEAKKEIAPNINTASLDEIESFLGVSRKIAKDIVKTRVKNGFITLQALQEISGVGKKTVSKAKEIFLFNHVDQNAIS